MKDAKAILNKVYKIKEKIPNASVSLKTNAPICSKSIKFLEENNVEIITPKGWPLVGHSHFLPVFAQKQMSV